MSKLTNWLARTGEGHLQDANMYRGMTKSTGAFSVEPLGPFSLAASIRFLEGFEPAAMGQQPQRGLALAFCLEGSWTPVAVDVWQEGERVLGRYLGDAPPEIVAQNVSRLLSIDVDGREFAAVGKRDAVVGRLQERYPGLRPVGFWSAYEAAVWTVLSQRVRMVQAAGLKQRIAEQIGHSFELGGGRLTAFPAPALLPAIDDLGVVPRVKAERLLGVAQAAERGLLDSMRLRSLAPDTALAELQQIPGIGPFSADLILIRGAMAPDMFPSTEKRLHSSMRAAYGTPDASVEQLTQIAEAWRPYRSWVSVLFRTAGEAGQPPTA